MIGVDLIGVGDDTVLPDRSKCLHCFTQLVWVIALFHLIGVGTDTILPDRCGG